MTAAASTVAANPAGDPLDGLPDRLAGIVHQLSGSRQSLEQVFLGMGEHLLGSTSLLNEVAAAHEGMPAELESVEFNTAAEHLETIRDDVARMAASHSDEGGLIERLAGMARAVSSPLHDLRKAMRAIRLVAVNARIAAVGIGGQQGELSAFTTDMMVLGQSVEEAVAAFAKAHDTLVESLVGAADASSAFTKRHGGTMNKVSVQLTEHLRLVDAHRERARGKAAEHAVLTGQIRSRVGSAVSALQIGDITRQRVEHVEQMLEMLAGHTSGPPSPMSLSTSDTLAAVCHLAAAQLDQALSDFDHQIAELALSLRRLAHDATEILRLGNKEAEASLDDGDTALGAIIDDLVEIRALLRDFAQTRARTEKMAAEVARSAAVMVDRLGAIEETEQKIRLLSLNTAIQCGRLGDDGNALRVIARELRDIAGQTVAAAGAITHAMTDAQTLAGRLLEGDGADSAHRIADLEGKAETAIHLFGAVLTRLRARVGTMTATGPRAVRQFEAAAGHVSGRRDLGASWRDAFKDVLALVTNWSEGFDAGAADETFLNRIRGRYTMDSERHVHDTLLGGSPPAADPVGSVADAQDDDDNIFF